jgi:hypothetical protein
MTTAFKISDDENEESMTYYYTNKLGVKKSLHTKETADGQFDIFIINEENGEHCGTGSVTKEQLDNFLLQYGLKGE